MMNAEI